MSREDGQGGIKLFGAPINQNLEQAVLLVGEGGLPIADAFRLITTNPAKNLSLKQKGHLAEGADADLCFFDEDLNLHDVMARGKFLMRDNMLLMEDNL